MSEFELQFKNKKFIDFYNKSVNFVDVTPPVLKSNIPIFIAPGWGENQKTFKDLACVLFDLGFRVISVTYPRHDLKLITKKNISRFEFQKANIILSLFDFLNVRKVNTIAHSEGAINTVIAAQIKPELFNNILLFGPGGLVDAESFFELVLRFLGNIIQGGVRALKDKNSRLKLVRSGVETLKYFLMNPVLGLLEGSAISNSHLHKFLFNLHKHNIKISVIHGQDDIVFPIKKMNKLKSMEWINFYTVKGDHNDIYVNPKSFSNFIQDQLIIDA